MSDTRTTFEHIVSERRSVRAFLDKPVPHDQLEAICELAARAPSNCNTQPWQVYIASGEKLETLRAKLPEAVMMGQFDMDYPYDGVYEGDYKDRQYDAANQLYSAMGIKREEKDKRNVAFMNNFTFFGAPHAAFFFLPENFGIRESADLGMCAQTFMLSLSAFGLASCPQTALSFGANIVRETLGVPANCKLLFGVSFGYEDTNNPANDCRVSRDSLGSTFHLCE